MIPMAALVCAGVACGIAWRLGYVAGVKRGCAATARADADVVAQVIASLPPGPRQMVAGAFAVASIKRATEKAVRT